MLLSLVQTVYASPFQSNAYSNLTKPTCVLHKSLFPCLDTNLRTETLTGLLHLSKRSYNSRTKKFPTKAVIHASLIEAPILWACRLFIFYALLKIGFAGSEGNPLVSDLDDGVDDAVECDDLGFFQHLDDIQDKPEKGAPEERKLVSKWRPTAKGTLKMTHRVFSKHEGQRLLKAIASLLSDDDHFRDATSHKGCQIRRQNAHAQCVCCNNVRALFDELPTGRLIVEITPFPAGPLTENDYLKAAKLERVLKSSPSA